MQPSAPKLERGFESDLLTDTQRRLIAQMGDLANRIPPQNELSEGQLRELQAQQLRQAIADNNATIKKLQEELKNNALEAKQSAARARKFYELLKNLVNGMRSTDVEVPGYEDAMAFFIQEKMLKRGGDLEIEPNGDISIAWDDTAEKILKL